MGGGASKNGGNRAANNRGGNRGPGNQPGRGEHPRYTNDDLFSSDPLFSHTESNVRPIDELSPRGSYQQPVRQENGGSINATNGNRGDTLGPQRPPQRAYPIEARPHPLGSRAPPPVPVNRWMGGQPWLGRDGWPQGHPQQNMYGQAQPRRLHPGYQVVRPPRYEDVIRTRGPAPRPERPEQLVQPIERQQEQVPAPLSNQIPRSEPQKPHVRPNYDDHVRKNSRVEPERQTQVQPNYDNVRRNSRVERESQPQIQPNYDDVRRNSRIERESQIQIPPHYNDDVRRNSRLEGERDNLQNVEVQSLLSYDKEAEPAVDRRRTRSAENVHGTDVNQTEVDDRREKMDLTKVTVFKEDDDEYIGANLRFYRNEIPCRPNGDYIDNMHKYWYGDYYRLEKSQTYIQWLFPLPELSSVNPYALPLQKHEAKYIRDDDETYGRVVTSYQMMLDFFGMTLADPNTGQVGRSDIWKERYSILKRSGKNYFRITRIIRSLGALGFFLYQAPWVMFLLHEVLETKELAAVPPGIIHTWLGAIDNAYDREFVRKTFQQRLNALNKMYEKKNVRISLHENANDNSRPQNERDRTVCHRRTERYPAGGTVSRIEE